MKVLKSKKLIVIFGFLFFIFGIVLYNVLTYSETKVYNYDSFHVDLLGDIHYCKEGMCDGTLHYATFTLSDISSDFQKVVDDINSEIKKAYNLTLKSNTDSSECSSVSNKYKNRYLHDFEYMAGETKDYITIEYAVTTTDLCTDLLETTSPVIYVYSKKDQKVISQDEFVKRLHLRDFDVEMSIKAAISLYNDGIGDNEKKLNYSHTKKDEILYFYYGTDLSLFFYQDHLDSNQVYYVKVSEWEPVPNSHAKSKEKK